MKNFLIYNYTPVVSEGSKPYTASLLFIPGEGFSTNTLGDELKFYFQSNLIPDDLFVISGKDLTFQLVDFFITKYPQTFQFINQSAVRKFSDSVHVITFDGNGELELHSDRKNGILEKAKLILSEGLIQIFVERGGLIQSRYSHHFVFPSGKHSESFLRTGNILMYGPEIYFIAFQLLYKFDPNEHKMILCDTSSISSLAYALIDLKKRLSPNFQSPPVNSFKSYSIFDEEELLYGSAALFLISSSTSGGIISRLMEKMSSIREENIVLIYFLGKYADLNLIKNNVICNLDKRYSSTGNGLIPFETHSPETCTLCNEKMSLAVNVVGDIFLSENPKVNRILLGVKHAPPELGSFAEEFIVKKKNSQNVLKCNYKEGESPDERYNIFIDMQEVFSELKKNNSDSYKNYRKSLFDKIRHHIPAQSKYIIALDDIASLQMAEIIRDELRTNLISPAEILSPSEITEKIDKEAYGAVVVVGSCMLTGRNLLLISKLLRDYEKLSIIYVIGVVRTRNHKNYKFIKSNLVQGAKGKTQNTFVEIVNICLPDDSQETVWQKEISFIGRLLDYLEENNANRTDDYRFYSDRKRLLESVDNENRGLANNLFYGTASDHKELLLNKNFAFLESEIHDTHSQADVYFIISMIINHLRQGQHNNDSLIQTEYLRQLIDPSNFLRYNDGIIQASILRAATAQELSFDLDFDCSLQMTQIIENEIELCRKHFDEALHEFLYAIVSQKLKLKSSHISLIFDKIKSLNISTLSILCDFYMYNKEIKKIRKKIVG